MARATTIRVMISSRCNDIFPAKAGTALSQVRRELKKDIESAKLFGKPIFEVWINEETPPQGGTWDSWEVCIRAVRDCDILIVLSNGNAGWAAEAGDVGICHLELMTGMSEASGKVFLLPLGNIPIESTAEGKRNQRFQEYVDRQSPFRGGVIRTVEDLRMRVQEAVREAVISLTQRGMREASRGRFHSGDALDWSRLDFIERQRAMLEVLHSTLVERAGTRDQTDSIVMKISQTDVLLVPHAIPAAMTVNAAREMVGQPFLRDHLFEGQLPRRGGGPFHIIAVHRTVTESQAARFPGFPDAIIVSGPFGIYVADRIQKIQFAFIANCRDESSTRYGVQDFLKWLDQTGEVEQMAERALSRAKIVRTIAAEATE